MATKIACISILEKVKKSRFLNVNFSQDQGSRINWLTSVDRSNLVLKHIKNKPL